MEKDFPRITFGIIVLNGEPYTKYCLRSLYPFAHEIIVVEGGSRWAIDQAPDGHSVDGTLQALDEFAKQEDPDHKLQIVTRRGFWSEKLEQSRAFAERATGDYLWIVAIDEFYKPQDMLKVLALVRRDPTITAVSFIQLPFWGSFHSTLHGWHSLGNVYEFHRLFKFGKGYEYVEHRPDTVLDPLGRDSRSVNWVRGQTMADRGISLYHYAFVFPKQVHDKIRYYWRHAPDTNQSYPTWYENNFMKISQPYHIYHDQSKPSWLQPFNRDHPSEIKKLISDLRDGCIKVQQRREDDIDKLLNSPVYRAKTLALSFFSGPAEQYAKGRFRNLGRVVKFMNRALIGLASR